MLLLIPVAFASVTQTLNAPADFAETTSTTNIFNWTSVSTVNASVTSYIYLNGVLNTSVSCINNTNCNATISGMVPGDYQWYIQTEDNSGNYSSLQRWLRIRDTENLTYFSWRNDSNFEAMRLNKNTGDLNINGTLSVASIFITILNVTTINAQDLIVTGSVNASDAFFIVNVSAQFILANLSWDRLHNYPSECSPGFAVTKIGDLSICTRQIQGFGDNIGAYNYTFNNNTFVINANVGMIGVNISIPSHALTVKGIVNASSFIGDGSALTGVKAGSFLVNGLNCNTGEIPLGVNASGAAEGCYNTSVANIEAGAFRPGNIIVDGNLTANNIFMDEHCHKHSQLIQTINNVSVYKRVSFESQGSECTLVNDNENFTITNDGDYHVNARFSPVKTTGGIGRIEAIILLNGNQVNGSSNTRSITSNNAVGFFDVDADIIALAGDNISIGITGTTDNIKLDNLGCILCFHNVTTSITIDRTK